MRVGVRGWQGPVLGFLCILAGASPVSWAQEGETIVLVDVRGASTVAKETILARVRTKAGSPYQTSVVRDDIRRLFALGYFTDVRADVEELADGLLLVFVVQEKPTVGLIQVEGNRVLRTDRFLQLFAMNPGELYDLRNVKEGIDLVKAEYARKGYSQTEIASRVETHELSNTMTVYLLVDEGPRMRIVQVLVEGNQVFSDKRLRKVIKTKRKRWFSSGVYNEQVLEEDLERVRAFYRKHGYQDIAVRHQVYRDESGRGLYVHLTLSEGLQHRVGDVALEGAVLFPEREIRRVVTLKPGAVYSTEALQEDLRLIKQYYGDRGYINAEVLPDPQLDQQTKRVKLTYYITENTLVYVNRVEVRGNLRTKDVVIRRELRVHPGDPFDGAKIRKSFDRLYNLGFFEEINVETEPTQDPEREDLIVKVKESKTGSFSFGGGFSSIDRLVGLVELQQRNFDWRNFPNFTGAGQDFRIRAELGSVRRFFDVSWTEPWIFGRPVSFGVDAYNRTRLQSRDVGLAFEEEQRGGGVRLGKEFIDGLHGGLSYNLFRTEISDVIDEASADLKAEQGRTTISVGGTSLTFDRRDNRFDPTQGYFLFISSDLAGGVFGADKDFVRVQTGASHYAPHMGRLVLESRIRAGIVDGYSSTKEVPIFERFFGGGSGTVRGFEERTVGPLDPFSNDPIGGESILVMTLEEVMSILEGEKGNSILKGSVFLDVGNVWRRVTEFGESFKAGAGVGVRVNTPIGPLRLDLGFPVSDLDPGEERDPQVHFNLSRSF